MPATTLGPPPTGGSGVEPRLVGIGDEYYPFLGNPGYDVQHYTLVLDYDPLENHLRARVIIDAVATEPLRFFNLDFDRLTVDSVRVDGESAAYAHANEEVTIEPASPIPQGAEFQVQVDYFGTPGPEPTEAVRIDTGWFSRADGSEAFVVAEPDNAHTWFPGNDHPLDKATFEFLITVPDGLLAAANGELISVEEAPDRMATYTWRMDEPMATYLATVVIGEFDLVVDEDATADAGGTTIRHVLPRGTTVASWPGLERQGEMLTFLEGLFGPYPFDRYGIAIVRGFVTALENQTLSIFGRSVTNPDIFERVLIHELAHQWFGDSVSPGLWRDIWLNEGFASYAEWLWIESELGRDTLDNSIEAERLRLRSAGLRPPGDPVADDLFNATVYRLGAMTLHALRLTVGDDAFFEILRSYHARFEGETATTFDFVDVAEEVSGMDLDDLFEAWLFGEEIPTFP